VVCRRDALEHRVDGSHPRGGEVVRRHRASFTAITTANTTTVARSNVGFRRRATDAPLQPPARLAAAMTTTADHATGPNNANTTSATLLISSTNALRNALMRWIVS